MEAAPLNPSSKDIYEVRVTQQKVPLFFPFKVAYGATLEAALTIVELADEEGHRGLGEGAPASYYSDQEKETACLLTQELANGLQGLSIKDAFERLYFIKNDYFNKAPIAFIAVETALWDLRAQQAGQSLCKEFGGPVRDAVRTDITLPQIDLADVGPFWNHMKPLGFSVVKIKVGGDFKKDVQRIEELLKHTPKDIEIFLDGNQGLTVEQSLNMLNQLEKLGAPQPLFFEQPLPREAWEDLKKLSDQSPIPVCLDETVSSVEDVERCIREETATMINLKIMKSGLAETLTIAHKAAGAGLEMMIGGMVESEITMNASLQIICAVPQIHYADLDTPFFLKRRLCQSSPWHSNSSKLILQGNPGLGLKLAPLESF